MELTVQELERKLQEVMKTELSGKELLDFAETFKNEANAAAKAAADEKRDGDLAKVMGLCEGFQSYLNEVPPENRKMPARDMEPVRATGIPSGHDGPADESKLAGIASLLMENRTDEQKMLERSAFASSIEAAWTNRPVEHTGTFKRTFAKYMGTSVLGKALSQVGTATGAEWIPTLMMSRVIELFRLSDSILSEHEIIPGLGYADEIPMWISGIKLFMMPPTSQDNKTVGRKSTPGTGKLTYNPRDFFVLIPLESRFEEDALAACISFFDQKLVTEVGYNLDDFIVNGSAAASHLDSDTVDPDDGRKAWDGYRKWGADASTTLDLSSFTDANFEALIVKLGKYGVRRSDLRAVIDPVTVYPKIEALCRTTSITNQLGMYDNGNLVGWHGVKFRVSEVIRRDLNASGVYDDTTKTYTCLPIVNVKQAAYIQKNDIAITRVEEWETGRPHIRITLRGAFKALVDSTATQTIGAVGIKIS